MSRRRDPNATAGLRSLLVLLYLLHLTDAFRYVPGSPCQSSCEVVNLDQDAVCLDDSYRDTENGTRIEDCVGCLLNSTAVDTANNATDVEWGLCMKTAHTLWPTTDPEPQLPCAILSPRACSGGRPSEYRYRVLAR
jgi:hypothetical protein